MKTFSHWRAVGRAMRWARQQEGVTAPLTAVDNKGRRIVILDWRHNGINVRVCWRRGKRMPLDIGVNFPERDDETAPFVGLNSVDKAATVLRVLAALELIPAEIAYAADERYGRCGRCGELAQWWPGEAEAEPRWVHTEPWRWLGSQAHNPVITEHKEAP